jgi:tetratricopeptide (TPR) repeat protein
MHDDLPKSFATLFQLGLTAAQSGNLSSAAYLFAQAIELEPNHPAAHGNRGAVLVELEQWQAALVSFDRAIMLKPDYAVAYSNRGNVLERLRRWDEALASYDRALAINPDLAEAYCNRGNVQRELKRWDDALASCNRALVLNPGMAGAHVNRGLVYRDLEQWDAALASYDESISVKADYAEAYCNRGIVLHDLGKLDAALDSFDRALALRPDFAEARFNRATALLSCGRFDEGWNEYEWRLQLEDGSSRSLGRNYPRPRWQGAESLAGKTLLLHAEQGMGDTLQFCRYVKAAAALGASVILEVQRPLKALLATLEGAALVVSPGEEVPAFDYYCSLMSLPLAFKTTLATVPARVPYIRSDPEKWLFWKEKLGHTAKRRVGIVWSGGFRPDQPELWSVNDRRNVPLAKLAPLKHPDIEFYSLQKGQPAESELTELVAGKWDGPQLIDFTHLLHDFSDTAALIDQMDLVISVDTSTAHLAGALGKPVWLLNRFDSCWRWLLDRTDSPWYPTLRVYRQARSRDWDGVVDEVRRAL